MNLDITDMKDKTLAAILGMDINIEDMLFEVIEDIGYELDKKGFDAEIVKETEKAYLLNFTMRINQGNLVSVSSSGWFPKSQTEIIRTIEGEIGVICPKWLARKKIEHMVN